MTSTLPPNKEDVRYINFEAFPGSVTDEEGWKSLNEQLKIIATDSHLVIYEDFDLPLRTYELLSWEQVDRKTYIVQTDAGQLTIKREENCGCGNRLRGFHPFLGVPHIAHYPDLKGT